MDELVVKDLIDRLIDLSFAEDIGDGDHTTLSCIPADAMGKSKLLIKEEGILAGIEVAKEVFRRFDPTMKVEVFIQDGTHVKPGDVAMMVEGKVQSLLQTERLMLNIMQRMSGIATMTNKYVKKLEGTKTRVLDTRKTTPGMRIMEKMAVKIGGGCHAGCTQSRCQRHWSFPNRISISESRRTAGRGRAGIGLSESNTRHARKNRDHPHS